MQNQVVILHCVIVILLFNFALFVTLLPDVAMA